MDDSRRHQAGLALILFIALVAVVGVYAGTGSAGCPSCGLATQSIPDGFVEQIGACNDARPTYRFSCYRAALETHYGEAPEAVMGAPLERVSFDGANVSFGVYGPNCYTFHHAMGDFIAEKMVIGEYPQRRVEAQLERFPARCRGGAIMGFANRMAQHHNFSRDWLRRFWESCDENHHKLCDHQLGHLTADKYIASHLWFLDRVSRQRYGLTPVATAGYVPYRYPPNISGAFNACDTLLPENREGSCYTGVGHNQFIYTEFQGVASETGLARCNRFTDGARRTHCQQFMLYRIGINQAGDRFIRGDTAEGNRICRAAVEPYNDTEIVRFCYQGIGSAIGLYMDSTYEPPVYETNLTEAGADTIREELRTLLHRCDDADRVEACYQGYMGRDFMALYQALNMSDPRIDTMLARICPRYKAPEGFELDCSTEAAG